MTGTPPTTYADEEHLVAALRSGDERAFAWLLDTYHERLRRLARNYVSTDAVAEEVVQETWLGVVRGLCRFEGRSSLKTWIHQILLNTARTRGVKEHRSLPFSSAANPDVDDDTWHGAFDPERFRTSGDWAGWWADPPKPWEPDEQTERAEVLDLVRDAINELPENQRIVMSLRDIDGWTSEEVCNVLDITQTNQRVILHRARARVRAAIDPHLQVTDV
jgi:RNA polymerase sigma-70 factor (ECF subfamily)